MWDYICGIMFVGLYLWDYICGIIYVGLNLWDYFCGIIFVGLDLWDYFCGIIFVRLYLWDFICGILFYSFIFHWHRINFMSHRSSKYHWHLKTIFLCIFLFFNAFNDWKSEFIEWRQSVLRERTIVLAVYFPVSTSSWNFNLKKSGKWKWIEGEQ